MNTHLIGGSTSGGGAGPRPQAYNASSDHPVKGNLNGAPTRIATSVSKHRTVLADVPPIPVDTKEPVHRSSALEFAGSGISNPVLPPATYDEQVGETFSQSFTSIAYNVTAVPQTDADGYGPGYLLNGLSSNSYWYQVGLSYQWPYANGGYYPGFEMNYETFDSSGQSIFPSSGGGGGIGFSGPVNAGDEVLLTLYFSGGNVVMSATDWSTGASASESYSAEGATYFQSGGSNGFFTGLMTEWWHSASYYSNEQEVVYSDSTFALPSADLWADEWIPSTGQSLFYNSEYVAFSNPSQLQSFSTNGITSYANANEFITGYLAPSTTITLLPAGESIPLSASNKFTLSYTLNGLQLTTYDTGLPIQLEADPGTNVVISAVTTASSNEEEWVFDSQTPAVSVPSGSTITLYYYDLLAQPTFYYANGGGYPSPPTLSYITAPATLSNQMTIEPESLTLTSSPEIAWALRGSSVAVTNAMNGTQGERWSTQNYDWAITGADELPSPIMYYHQFQVTPEFSATGGTGYSFPSVSCEQYGSSVSASVGTTMWVDADSYCEYSPVLGGSTQAERWAVPSPEVVVTSAGQISSTYFDQYSVVTDYSLVGGGSKTPAVYIVSFGRPTNMVLNESGESVWSDANSPFSLSNPLPGSTSTERWFSASANQTTIKDPTRFLITYYHQFQLEASYEVRDGDSPLAPSLSSTQFGNPISMNISSSGTPVWLDNGVPWSLSNPLTGLSPTERWYSPSVTNGTVTGALSLSPVYYHQFELILAYVVEFGGSPSPPTFLGTQSGLNLTVALTLTPNMVWIDGGTHWSLTNPLPRSGTNERWFALAGTSGVVSSSGTITPSYHHQYLVALSVNDLPGGTISPSPTWYDSGSSATFSATASSGWKFIDWVGSGSDSYSGQGATQSRSVVGAFNETAVFYPGLTVTVTGSGHVAYQYAVRSGSFNGSSGDVIFVPPSTNVTLSASPSSFIYEFEKWNGSLSAPGPRGSVIVSTPLEVRATFGYDYMNIGILSAGVIGVVGIAIFLLKFRDRLRVKGVRRSNEDMSAEDWASLGTPGIYGPESPQPNPEPEPESWNNEEESQPSESRRFKRSKPGMTLSRLWIAPAVLLIFGSFSYYLLVSPPSAYYSTYSPFYSHLVWIFGASAVGMIIVAASWEIMRRAR